MSGVLAFLASLIIVICLVVGTMNFTCTSSWPPEFEPQFKFGTGCTIVVDGHRIPAVNYRVM